MRIALQAHVSRYGLWRRRAALEGLSDEAAALLEKVGLADRAARLARELAHGQQRALEIAVALAAKKLLLMDEPTAGMSPEETKVMMELIRKLVQQRTVVLVEHKMKLVMGISERIVVLHHQGQGLGHFRR